MERNYELDFFRSSRRAWNLVTKLNPDNLKKKDKWTVISADTVGKQIKEKGTNTPRHKFERNVRQEFQKLYHECPNVKPLVTAPIRTNQIKQEINEIKQGKSAGNDSIHTEMIKNLREKALSWLAATISDILKTFKYSESWKHAKIIAVLKSKNC